MFGRLQKQLEDAYGIRGGWEGWIYIEVVCRHCCGTNLPLRPPSWDITSNTAQLCVMSDHKWCHDQARSTVHTLYISGAPLYLRSISQVYPNISTVPLISQVYPLYLRCTPISPSQAAILRRLFTTNQYSFSTLLTQLQNEIKKISQSISVGAPITHQQSTCLHPPECIRKKAQN